MLVSTAATSIPARSAVHFYSKSASFNPLSAVAVIYSALASLSIACLKPIPFLNRGLPQIQQLPPPPAAVTTDSSSKKIAIVTGANTGIGYETSKALVQHGYQVVLACRSKDKAMEAIERIHQELDSSSANTAPVPGKAVYQGTLDLSSFQSVHKFSQSIQSKYDKIDLLINNAGRNTSGRSPQNNNNKGEGSSEEDLDLCFQTNFLGHFLLTRNLMDLLLNATNPRVINLSSVMHHFCKAENGRQDEEYWKQNALYGSFSETNSYSASKLAALLFTIELNKQYGGKGLRSIAVNPGAVNSDIWRGYPRWLVKIFSKIYLNVRQGAYTSIAASVLDNLPPSVIYLQPYYQVRSDSTPFPPFEMLGPFVGYQAISPRLPKDGTNGELTAKALWQVSEELTATTTTKVD